MYLTGFADEAARGIDAQIRATVELGWRHIEARNVDGKNLHDLSEQDFERVCEKLEAAGVAINCFGSAIANCVATGLAGRQFHQFAGAPGASASTGAWR